MQCSSAFQRRPALVQVLLAAALEVYGVTLLRQAQTAPHGLHTALLIAAILSGLSGATVALQGLPLRPHSFALALLRGYAVLLQGTWLAHLGLASLAPGCRELRACLVQGWLRLPGLVELTVHTTLDAALAWGVCAAATHRTKRHASVYDGNAATSNDAKCKCAEDLTLKTTVADQRDTDAQSLDSNLSACTRKL